MIIFTKEMIESQKLTVFLLKPNAFPVLIRWPLEIDVENGKGLVNYLKPPNVDELEQPEVDPDNLPELPEELEDLMQTTEVTGYFVIMNENGNVVAETPLPGE